MGEKLYEMTACKLIHHVLRDATERITKKWCHWKRNLEEDIELTLRMERTVCGLTNYLSCHFRVWLKKRGSLFHEKKKVSIRDFVKSDEKSVFHCNFSKRRTPCLFSLMILASSLQVYHKKFKQHRKSSVLYFPWEMKPLCIWRMQLRQTRESIAFNSRTDGPLLSH